MLDSGGQCHHLSAAHSTFDPYQSGKLGDQQGRDDIDKSAGHWSVKLLNLEEVLLSGHPGPFNIRTNFIKEI